MNLTNVPDGRGKLVIIRQRLGDVRFPANRGDRKILPEVNAPLVDQMLAPMFSTIEEIEQRYAQRQVSSNDPILLAQLLSSFDDLLAHCHQFLDVDSAYWIWERLQPARDTLSQLLQELAAQPLPAHINPLNR